MAGCVSHWREPVPVGGSCTITNGVHGQCEEGAICVAFGTLAGTCEQFCSPMSDGDGTFTNCLSLDGDEQTCRPISSIEGLGFCVEACSPFPRRPDGGYPDCRSPLDTCNPFLATEDRAVTVSGECLNVPRERNDRQPGEVCTDPGFRGGGCGDVAHCREVIPGASTGICQSLCNPFSTVSAVCGPNATCDVKPVLSGSAAGACVEGAQPGQPGDRCEDVGETCEGDGTFCFPVGSSGRGECLSVCRVGFANDCPAGRRCSVDLFSSATMPYLGACIPD